MPARVAIAKACADPRWADRLAGAGLQCDSVQPLRWYVERLMQLGLTVNAWETTFFHVLHGDDPILAWYEGTALPPLLERLDVEEAIAFRERVGLLLRQAYPAAGDMTTFPFPRLFFVARKAGGATS
jgi:trans-aconitate 2-methyltransferase